MNDITHAIDQVITDGRTEYPDDFDHRSAYVVGVSANADELREAIAGLGGDAHHVVAALADDPDEAARILQMRGTKMAMELGQFAAKATAKARTAVDPKPQPQPATKSDIFNPDLDMKTWAKAWDQRKEDARATRIRSASEISQVPERKLPTVDIYDPNISSEDFNRLWTHRERQRRELKRFR